MSPVHRKPTDAAAKSRADAEVADLVHRASAGDRAAWDALVARYVSLVWAVALQHGIGESDAADVAQSTWLRLLEHIDEIRDPARIGAWLATTARRESLRVVAMRRRLVLEGDADAFDGPDRLLAPADERMLADERGQRRQGGTEQSAAGVAVTRPPSDGRPADVLSGDRRPARPARRQHRTYPWTVHDADADRARVGIASLVTDAHRPVLDRRCVITRYVVIGGGIVGLATARALLIADPGAQVTVLEKEDRWAAHQTGHNSGVVHSGVAYVPGSLKAQLCTAGARSMVAYAQEHDIPVEVCGKLVVATEPEELPRLAALFAKGQANGVPVRQVTPAEAREMEPEVACIGAVHVASTAIIDYVGVCESLAAGLAESGADLRLGTRVTALTPRASTTIVGTTGGDVEADVVVNCGGLASDRVAALMGSRPPVRIVPFRGEYFVLRPDRAHLVRGLVYPVADPASAVPRCPSHARHRRERPCRPERRARPGPRGLSAHGRLTARRAGSPDLSRVLAPGRPAAADRGRRGAEVAVQAPLC